jgi:murein DD-endopeptidase MepM/ murein hydrolase activator NlpD
MRQQYFILVLAHSLHGRLRRIHVPYKTIYLALGFLALGSFSLFGMFSSYLRMTWKVSHYNSLRQEVETLRTRYQALQEEANRKNEQLASLQLLAQEVSVAYGIKQRLDGPDDISGEGKLVPTYRETLEQYNFLKSASYSMIDRSFFKQWQMNTRPSIWPVYGRLLSPYGARSDPFSGEGAFHTGVDLAAAPGTPVHVTADGVILRAQWENGYGKLVVVDHGNGMQTWYAHLSRFEVVPGEEVRMGQVIALSGSTGRVTAPHLHYEVRVGGNPVNPYPYLTRLSPMSSRPRDLPF